MYVSRCDLCGATMFECDELICWRCGATVCDECQLTEAEGPTCDECREKDPLG